MLPLPTPAVCNSLTLQHVYNAEQLATLQIFEHAEPLVLQHRIEGTKATL